MAQEDASHAHSHRRALAPEGSAALHPEPRGKEGRPRQWRRRDLACLEDEPGREPGGWRGGGLMTPTARAAGRRRRAEGGRKLWRADRFRSSSPGSATAASPDEWETRRRNGDGMSRQDEWRSGPRGSEQEATADNKRPDHGFAHCSSPDFLLRASSQGPVHPARTRLAVIFAGFSPESTPWRRAPRLPSGVGVGSGSAQAPSLGLDA
jgi:hypothetical protein